MAVERYGTSSSKYEMSRKNADSVLWRWWTPNLYALRNVLASLRIAPNLQAEPTNLFIEQTNKLQNSDFPSGGTFGSCKCLVAAAAHSLRRSKMSTSSQTRRSRGASFFFSCSSCAWVSILNVTRVGVQISDSGKINTVLFVTSRESTNVRHGLVGCYKFHRIYSCSISSLDTKLLMSETTLSKAVNWRDRDHILEYHQLSTLLGMSRTCLCLLALSASSSRCVSWFGSTLFSR